MANQSEVVDQFMRTLDHPFKKEVEAVRHIILGANKDITEQIKWSAPSFCYAGDDRITFNLHAKDSIQLIFHRGAKPKAGNFSFTDDTGLVKWLAKDRGMVTLRDMDEVKDRKSALVTLVNAWVNANK